MALGLEEILHEPWLSALRPTIEALEDAAAYIGVDRPSMIPHRHNTFEVLRHLDPKDVRVIVFGQDPFPRPESAVGIAFCDGAITTWDQKFSPSFRNLVKGAFIHKGLMTTDDKIDVFRETLVSSGIVEPVDWFCHTIDQGVLWLNLSLTFTTINPRDTRRHTNFWTPVVRDILRIILEAKRHAVSPDDKGVVLTLFGDFAKKAVGGMLAELEEVIEGEPRPLVKAVELYHPAMEGFFKLDAFKEIAGAFDELGMAHVDWVPTMSRGPARCGDKIRAAIVKAATVEFDEEAAELATPKGRKEKAAEKAKAAKAAKKDATKKGGAAAKKGAKKSSKSDGKASTKKRATKGSSKVEAEEAEAEPEDGGAEAEAEAENSAGGESGEGEAEERETEPMVMEHDERPKRRKSTSDAVEAATSKSTKSAKSTESTKSKKSTKASTKAAKSTKSTKSPKSTKSIKSDPPSSKGTSKGSTKGTKRKAADEAEPAQRSKKSRK